MNNLYALSTRILCFQRIKSSSNVFERSSCPRSTVQSIINKFDKFKETLPGGKTVEQN